MEDKLSRREFLRQAGLLLGGSTLGGLVLASACAPRTAPASSALYTTISQLPGVIYSPDTLRVQRIPPGQHQVDNWPQVQAGPTPTISPQDWSFTISGQVENEVKLGYAEFTALPSEKVFSDVHCVTGWTRLNNLWEGWGTKTIAGLVKLKPDAKFVIVSAPGGFTANLTLADFLQDDVLFAAQHDGEPLSPEHGGPVRLVVPRLYFWKSAKWVTGLEFTAEDHPGFWERLGYNNHGDPWREERYS